MKSFPIAGSAKINYYPFGMVMPGRKFDGGSLYRYGFNGQEHSRDLGEDSYTAEYWQYDARLGRRWNVDPRPSFGISNYAVFKNNPIYFMDPLGDTTINGVFHENQTNGGTLEGVIVTGRKIKPRDKNESAILRKDYLYTRNYGWVDFTHAFTQTNRKYVGAANLWRSIISQDGEKGSGGYKVSYMQDASVGGFLVGIKKDYMVAYGLNIYQMREVAIAILRDVSWDFENMQGLAWWSNSSYEVSDLPSNILGLYQVMYNRRKSEMIDIIDPLTPSQSIDIYRENPESFIRKNKSFEPIFYTNKHTSNTHVPYILRSVSPAKIGPLSTGHTVDHWPFVVPYEGAH